MKLKKIAIILFVISLIVVIFTNLFISYDYFWHVKAGEYIVENGIPTVDVFSWYAINNSLTWISHEWLFEVIIYGLSTIFKDLTPYIYAFVFTTINLGILYYFNRKKIKNINFFLIWGFIGTIILGQLSLARPQLISNVLFSLTLFLCFDKLENKESKKIYFLPLIALLWSNIHGGSSNLVYLIPLIFIGTSLVKIKLGRLETEVIDSKQLKAYLIVIALSIIAIIINPHTYHMLLYPYINMMDHTMINFISEWQSLDIKIFMHLLMAIFIFISYLVLIISKKKIRALDFILILMFTYMSFRSIRFTGLFYIATTYVIFNYIDTKRELNKLSSKAVIIVSSILIILGTVISPINFSIKNKDIISAEMINYLQDNNFERIYNDYEMGGYLIYHDIKVFIDGRADIYSKSNLNDSKSLMYFDIHTEKIFNSYDFDAVLTKIGDLEIYLRTREDYELVLEDEENVLFIKKK